MTNREYYKEQILDIACSGYSIAMDRETHKLVPCVRMYCEDCIFSNGVSCEDKLEAWCNSEYKPPVDWSKVTVDTKVLVSKDGKGWLKRYFAEYKDGQVFTFPNGTTSWNCEGRAFCWQYAKLAEE